VLDVNGGGRKDLVTSMAHDYGVFWMENLGGGKWAKRVIDDTWSQAHALTMVDLNGDGRPDFVTGKRYMAHNGSDPGEREPLGIYWYEYRPTKDGAIESSTSSTTAEESARACKSEWRIWTATAIWISLWAGRRDCSCSRIYRKWLRNPGPIADAAAASPHSRASSGALRTDRVAGLWSR